MSQASGYSYATKDLVLERDSELSNVNFSLEPGYTLTGKALEKKSGNPAQNPFFEIRDSKGTLVLAEEVNADSLGNYLVTGLGAGNYTLHAFANNVAPLYNIPLVIQEIEENKLDLWFLEGGTLSVKVINEEQEGVEHAKVDVYSSGGMLLHYPLSLSTFIDFEKILFTDGDGRLTRAHIPAGSHTVRIEASGYLMSSKPIQITEGKTTDLTVILQKQ